VSGFFGLVKYAGIALLALFAVVEIVYGLLAVVSAINPEIFRSIIPL
jgi:hypothetical protein